MKKFVLPIVAIFGLSGCASEQRTYEMSVETAAVKLMRADFKRSILPGSSLLKPKVQRNYEGDLEWQVLDDSENGNGWWCPIKIEPVDEQKGFVRVINQCEGIMAKDNKNLDELVDATLTGRPPVFN